jgi:hypothetical protein
MQKLIQIPACLDHGWHVLKPRSFPRAPRDMNHAGETSIVLWFVSKEFQHTAIQTKIEQHFRGFFHQIKVRHPIERQDSMQTVIQTIRRLDSFLNEVAQNLTSFLIFKRKN